MTLKALTNTVSEKASTLISTVAATPGALKDAASAVCNNVASAVNTVAAPVIQHVNQVAQNAKLKVAEVALAAEGIYDTVSTKAKDIYFKLTVDQNVTFPKHTEESFVFSALDAVEDASDEEIEELIDMGALPTPEETEQRIVALERTASLERTVSTSSVESRAVALPKEKTFVILFIFYVLFGAIYHLLSGGVIKATEWVNKKLEPFQILPVLAPMI